MFKAHGAIGRPVATVPRTFGSVALEASNILQMRTFSLPMQKMPMIYSTFTSALPGRRSAIGCALRRLAFPLDPYTPEFVTRALEALDADCGSGAAVAVVDRVGEGVLC